MKKKYLVSASLLVSLCSVNLFAADTLKIITWKGYAPKALVEKFEKETGIDVEVTYSNNEEMIAKLRATRGAGFDLAQPSQDRISSVQSKYKIYQAIDYSKIDEKQIVDSMLSAVKKNTNVKGASYAVPFNYGTSGLIVNTKMAPNAKDYDALLDAQYSGKISYRLKRPTLLAISFAKGEDPFSKYSDAKEYKKLVDDSANELIKAKKHVKTYYANGDALLELLRSKEVYVAMGWDNGGWKLHKENKDIDFIAPKSGALGWIDTFAIPSKAKNTKAAYAWINFMLKPQNAAYFTNKEGYATASKDAKNFLNKEIKDNFQRSFTDADINNINWYPPVPAKLEKIEGKLLDKVKASK